MEEGGAEWHRYSMEAPSKVSEMKTGDPEQTDEDPELWFRHAITFLDAWKNEDFPDTGEDTMLLVYFS